MANDRQNLLAKEMAELRKQFHGQLLTDLKSLSASSSMADAVLLAPTMLIGLRDTCHRLAGSTLTFGYNNIGNALRELEHVLNSALEKKALEPDFIRLKLERLPELESEIRPDQVAEQADSLSNAQMDEAENYHLYVLEDERATGEMLRIGLASFGYQVTTFNNPTALREAFQRQKPDALIVDIVLGPGVKKNGIEIATELNAISSGSTPVIVISEHDGFNEKLLAARSGAAAFFNKPVNIPAMETQLDYLLRQRSKSPYRVLLVDDDQYSLAHYRLLLQTSAVNVRTLPNPMDIFEAMDEFHPELLVFDLHMPKCNGIELAQTVRFHPQWLHIPIIFLSAEQNENQQMSALLKGGDGFLTKPVTGNIFTSTILSSAQRARQLADLMSRDSLTGLLKHSEIKERLHQEMARAEREGTEIAVAMIDIDRFKLVNDSYGHQTGDLVISSLAHLLRHSLRVSDLIGRYGGEEYLVVFPVSTVEQARHKLDQLREEFSQIPFLHHNAEFHCTFSAGISSSLDSTSVDELVEKADNAMYQAKKAGRNRIV